MKGFSLYNNLYMEGKTHQQNHPNTKIYKLTEPLTRNEEEKISEKASHSFLLDNILYGLQCCCPDLAVDEEEAQE